MLDKLQNITKNKLANGLWSIRRNEEVSVYQVQEMDYFEDHERKFKPDFDDSIKWGKISTGQRWGGYDKIFWFKAQINFPEHLKGGRFFLMPSLAKSSNLDVVPNYPESLLFINGAAVQGIDKYHKGIFLPQELLEKKTFTIHIRSWTRLRGKLDYTFFGLEFFVVNPVAQKYYFLAKNVLDTIEELDKNDFAYSRLLDILNDSYKKIDFAYPRSQEYYDSITQAFTSLSEGLKKLDFLKREVPTIVVTGHSHLDMAWLWRVLHTREKAQRTFATVLNLMEEYPEYTFIHSSPCLYKYLKKDYPELYEKVKEKIKEGKWEATGGMWVESDSNISPGEFLIRQILFGKRFLREEFGAESKVVWLPDAFGYTYSLPQIIKKSGMNYFATTKISWNEFNRFPYDTFWWKGTDGTEILAHFITTPDKHSYYYTYNGMLEPFTVQGIWDNYKQKDINEELLLVFGWGDGGGGPTFEMLENYEAMKQIPALYNIEMGSVENYFEKLDKRIQHENVPVWDDELYFELHRGTYTSQAFIKRENRKSEVLYHNAEFLNSVAKSLFADFEYPQTLLNEGWELLLLNQFHDILPGSSIREVYEDARQDFEKIKEIANNEIRKATSLISNHIKTQEDSVVVFNTTNFERNELIELGNGIKTIIDGIPPLGYKTVSLPEIEKSNSENDKIKVNKEIIENKFYIIEFNGKGQIKRLYDKENQREVLEEGKCGNVLQAFEDRPYVYDAWDISFYFNEKMKEVTNLVDAEVEESDNYRGILKFTWEFYKSKIEQRVIVYNHSRRIDFDTKIDWKERQILLKAAFPVNIRSTKATYNIQFGNIERSTTNNTSYDIAKFEVPAQKWADLSEGNFGVSILNDCKYGYDIKDNIMRITLLRSPIDPDETADRTEHRFVYSLLPHKNTWREGKVIEEAYKLNYPVMVEKISINKEGNLPNNFSLFKINDSDIIVETIKKAEDDNSIIVRVYEGKGGRKQDVSLIFYKDIKMAYETNLIEEEEKQLPFEGKEIIFNIDPYEIKTFKVEL